MKTQKAEQPGSAGPADSQESVDRNFRLVADIPVRLSVEVGSVSLALTELLDLAEGSIVELNRQAHELLDINANGRLIARGEVVTTNGRFGVRVVDVIAPEPATGSMDRRR